MQPQEQFDKLIDEVAQAKMLLYVGRAFGLTIHATEKAIKQLRASPRPAASTLLANIIPSKSKEPGIIIGSDQISDGMGPTLSSMALNSMVARAEATPKVPYSLTNPVEFKLPLFPQDPAVTAIQYAIEHPMNEPMAFLECWFHGDFESIRKEWPDAPESVFVNADPLLQRTISEFPHTDLSELKAVSAQGLSEIIYENCNVKIQLNTSPKSATLSPVSEQQETASALKTRVATLERYFADLKINLAKIDEAAAAGMWWENAKKAIVVHVDPTRINNDPAFSNDELRGHLLQIANSVIAPESRRHLGPLDISPQMIEAASAICPDLSETTVYRILEAGLPNNENYIKASYATAPKLSKSIIDKMIVAAAAVNAKNYVRPITEVFRDAPQLPTEIATMQKRGGGLVIVGGEYDSGRTTTLASLAAFLGSPEECIAVSYELPPYVQVTSQRVMPDISFSWEKTLKIALRMDPKIVIFDEIRNMATAKLVIKCAKQGMLVLATLQCEGPIHALQRLQDEFHVNTDDLKALQVEHRLLSIHLEKTETSGIKIKTCY